MPGICWITDFIFNWDFFNPIVTSPNIIIIIIIYCVWLMKFVHSFDTLKTLSKRNYRYEVHAFNACDSFPLDDFSSVFFFKWNRGDLPLLFWVDEYLIEKINHYFHPRIAYIEYLNASHPIIIASRTLATPFWRLKQLFCEKKRKVDEQLKD